MYEIVVIFMLLEKQIHRKSINLTDCDDLINIMIINMKKKKFYNKA